MPFHPAIILTQQKNRTNSFNQFRLRVGDNNDLFPGKIALLFSESVIYPDTKCFAGAGINICSGQGGSVVICRRFCPV